MILVAGTVAIVHYANIGQALAGSPGMVPAVTTTVSATTTITSPSRTTLSPADQPDPDPASTQPDPPSPTAPTTALSTSKSPSDPPHKLGASSKPAPTRTTRTSPPINPGPAPLHFRTLPPDAKLPSAQACAQWVMKSPAAELRHANYHANHVTGQSVGTHFFPAADKPGANKYVAPLIGGDFTGTTTEILRWAACKWGINQNVVFAQAAVESWWRQGQLGDWGTEAADCPPGHKPTSQHPKCPQSYGILQNRYPYEKASWPGIGDSTAMNADTAYGIWRACYDGYEVWLNHVSHVGHYAKGDLWGCVGRWFAGRWHTTAAQDYITMVQRYLKERIWLTQGFRDTPNGSAPVALLSSVG
jgi:hypothetical protein